MVPGVLLVPYMSQGDQGVTETPIVSKGLSKMLIMCKYVIIVLTYLVS